MLRKIRIVLAALFFVGITLMFLDFTGTLHTWFGWMAKVQFLPAVLALNVGVVVGLVALTLILGRVYCSVVCPLGVMQDIISWISGRRKKHRHRFSYSRPLTVLRYAVLVLFIIALVAGVGSAAALLAPYSSYGRIVQNLFSPVYLCANNLLAGMAERMESYAFYEREVWVRSVSTFAIAIATFVLIAVLAWRSGRTYCNTICPVGSFLGLLARYSWLKPVINTEKCNSCGLCGMSCKASCIDSKAHAIDYSRCVGCMDCISVCKHGALSYAHAAKVKAEDIQDNTSAPDTGRRAFLAGTAMLATGLAVKAQEKKVDGGLAAILDKEKPTRQTPVVPPGAVALRHFAQHCTGCQLCVSACPNDVLRPSSGLMTLMQPEMSFERGYCRPECTKCSEVCPTGAILEITSADKAATQVGHAVWVKKNCVAVNDNVACDNCARHCPTGAITMIPTVAGDDESRKIPSINTERCIGCGACENLCPARPFSAIYVEGHEVHRNV
ncbi:MAG: 4Fe-4S binding protein [Bacteroidaceae bacterium]|nr:4Fe-4S binding protein [Bacteroidaceae bacterium]